MDEALESALTLFWRHGYDGTSLSMLTEAMGINGPSLYAAFGNKEGLFHRALERYDERYGDYFRAALAEPTARRVAETLMAGSIRQVTRAERPAGCLLVQGALARSEQADKAHLALRAARVGAEEAIRERFQRAIDEGDLPSDANAALLAKFVFSTNSGFAVQAASGATPEELQAVADMAMRAWPTQAVPVT